MAVSPSFVPAMLPPPGETPDFESPNPLWKWNVLCQSLCLLLTGTVFVLRTYIRLRIRRVWILEDFLCCLAFIGLVVYSSLLTAIIHKKGGVHEWDLTKPKVVSILYYNNIIQIWYGPTAAITKTTLLLLYLRIFSPRRSGRIDIIIRTLIPVVCLFYLATTVAKICQCIPRRRIWDKSVPGKCLDLHILLNSSGMFNIISDVCILLVPLKGIWNLQVSKWRKIGIYAVFTVGVIAPTFSTVGFVIRYTLGSGPDQTHVQSVISLWATAELATGMLIICLPTLPALLKRHARGPPASEISGSKSRGRKAHQVYGLKSADTEKTFLEGGYYELKENFLSNQLSKTPHTVLTINTGGIAESGYTTHQLSSREEEVDVPTSGILKTVKIEQLNIQESIVTLNN